MKSIKLCLPLLLVLAGCGSTPNQVVIAPDFIQTSNLPLNVGQISLNVNDMRTSKHLVQIVKEGQAANLFNSQLPVSDVIEKSLTEALKKRSVSINPNASTKVDITIKDALINVDQHTLKYQAKSDLLLSVAVQTPVGQLTKSYHHKGSSEGPLKADIAVLGRDFNQALTKVLNQMLNDAELTNYINQ
ncbi:hypothetical protein tloyanaT_07890 [Thalassotalea loyana]|uniref:Lipoprotein n=1 Tax=Thalassotalea loyana TaxID=280483 RepID=A0ABQ6H8T6_9GAMM|nr:YajG family lipoprotein [Thalassotalea loyana]GLX84537.1 hypothetical protein tloyanaT_07890 [Thalassotalea loyana]